MTDQRPVVSEVSGAAGPDVPDERAAKGSDVPAGVREATAARLAQAEGKPFELMSDWLKDVWLEEADAFLAELVPNLTSTIIQEYDADNESLAIANAGLANALERAEADADARVAAAVSKGERDLLALIDGMKHLATSGGPIGQPEFLAVELRLREIATALTGGDVLQEATNVARRAIVAAEFDPDYLPDRAVAIAVEAATPLIVAAAVSGCRRDQQARIEALEKALRDAVHELVEARAFIMAETPEAAGTPPHLTERIKTFRAALAGEVNPQ